MGIKTFTSVVGLLLLAQAASAQKLQFQLGLNLGGSKLFHETRFKETPLLAQYEIIEESFNIHGEDYTWEDFEKDFDLQSSFTQPRFGFSGVFSYGHLPLFLVAEAMSSPSDYTKMAFSGTIALGKDFYDYDSVYYLTFMGGYKHVMDKGFGSNTIVNSIRNDYMRTRMQEFFAPEKPLGSIRANLFTLRLGVGRTLGYARRIRVGLEGYGELDLIEKTVRPSRMTNAGVNLYLRFKILGGRRSLAFPI
jgi:hypothetical protein